MLKDAEFIKAIEHLSDKEKVKLIVRLLRRDKVLTQKLYFELVDTDSVEMKREVVATEITNHISKITKLKYPTHYFLTELRFLSGKITLHLKVTKDNFGEIVLNLQMLSEIIQQNNDSINNARPNYVHKFCIYVMARTFKVLLLINKLHPDLLLDLKPNLYQLGHAIGNNNVLMRYAIQHGLDVNWLTQTEIPEDIVEHHKQLKAMGFLVN